MDKKLWTEQLQKQCEQYSGQALIQDVDTLAHYNQDFGRLVTGGAVACFSPKDVSKLQRIVEFSNKHKLPLTIRSNGLSQSGQSLSPQGGVVLDIGQLNTSVEWRNEQLVAGCSASWRKILLKSLERDQSPWVLPYNTHLSLGGVLSVGGLGAATFKDGVAAAHIDELLVLTATGELTRCSRTVHSDLFQACLSGAGLFGVIIEAVLSTKKSKPFVRQWEILFDSYDKWLTTQFSLRSQSDYIEAFISDLPSSAKKQYIIRAAKEYESCAPDIDIPEKAQFEVSDFSFIEYANRHDSRIQQMKDTGAWGEQHPWYECYVSAQALGEKMEHIVRILDESIGGIYHVFPVAPNTPKFYMLPVAEDVVTFNVLPSGLKKDSLKRAILALSEVDEILMGLGGKRYISGWFQSIGDKRYWHSHYGALLSERNAIKLKYDPNKIFCSKLFSRDF